MIRLLMLGRWHVISTFSFLAFVQSMVWFTFSSVELQVLPLLWKLILIRTPNSHPQLLEGYFPDLDNSEVDLLLNWGPIIFLPVLPFVLWMLNSYELIPSPQKIY